MSQLFPVETFRREFPALSRTFNDLPVAHFDGPAGSQVPRSVAQAVADYLLHSNSNHGGPFHTSQESDALLDAAHRAVADFLGTPDPDTNIFGQNMTSLTFALSRALAKTWKPGDEIIVSNLDHDANVTPWVLAAADAQVAVKHIPVNPQNCTLDLTRFHELLSPRTRLVAVGYASNAVGTINPLLEIIDAAHAKKSLVFIDAVHYAPHGLIDVTSLDCDFLACSPYKFFGPHLGILYGKRPLLEQLTPYKLRPCTNLLPGKWMTGTQSHEAIAGAAAAINYLAQIGTRVSPTTTHQNRRAQLVAAWQAISTYENSLGRRLLHGLNQIPNLKIWGITDPDSPLPRVPTFSLTHPRFTPLQLATHLAAQGLFTWCGNHYAYPLTSSLGLEPNGTLRIGLLHYNTAPEVDRLLAALSKLLA